MLNSPRSALGLGPVAGLVLGLALGFCGGILGERWFAADPAQRDVGGGDSEAGRSAEALAAELRALIERMPREIRDQLRAEFGESSIRRPADAVATDVERLARAVEKLEQVLASSPAAALDDVARSRTTTAAWKGAGFASMLQLEQRARELIQSGDEDWEETLVEEFRAAHLLWRMQDVFDRYGRPSEIDTGDGFGLAYEQYSFLLTPTEKFWFVIEFSGDFVTNLSFRCDDVH